MKRRSESITSSKQPEINTKEENTRTPFNELCSELSAIVLPQKDKINTVSQADQIERATSYIVELKERVDKLNKRKEQLQTFVDEGGSSTYQTRVTTNTPLHDSSMSNSGLPTIQVKEIGSSLKVQLIMEVGHNSTTLHQVIAILEEEGAEVVNATSYTSGNQIIHTLHAKAKSARVGIEASRVGERLHGLLM